MAPLKAIYQHHGKLKRKTKIIWVFLLTKIKSGHPEFIGSRYVLPVLSHLVTTQTFQQLRRLRYESLLEVDEDSLIGSRALLRLEMTIPQKLFIVALMMACSWLDDTDTPLSTW